MLAPSYVGRLLPNQPHGELVVDEVPALNLSLARDGTTVTVEVTLTSGHAVTTALMLPDVVFTICLPALRPPRRPRPGPRRRQCATAPASPHSWPTIAPQYTEVIGFSSGWITPLLLLFGAGLFVGNNLGGRLADRWLMPSVLGTIATLAVVLFAMTWLIENQVAAVIGTFVFGAAAFAVVAPLQLRVMNAAGHAPDVASAANISAFSPWGVRWASTSAASPSTVAWASRR